MDSLWFSLKNYVEEESSASAYVGRELIWDLTVWAWSVLIFWVWNVPFLILDITHFPSFLYKYKLQKHAVTFAEVKKCVARVLFNQFAVALPVILLFSPILRWCGVHVTGDVPSLWTIGVHLFVFVWIEELFFFYTHWALHLWFYTSIHKIHHEFRAPISIASEYAHWIEYIGSNLMPLLLGPMFMGSHMICVLSWVTLAVIGTSHHHCGYQLPWLKGLQAPHFHDYHHYSFIWNYGLLGVLDWAYGTDVGFQDYVKRTTQGQSVAQDDDLKKS